MLSLSQINSLQGDHMRRTLSTAPSRCPSSEGVRLATPGGSQVTPTLPLPLLPPKPET